MVVVADFFESKEGDETFLECAEEAFDFAFSLGRRGHTMVHAQRAESALELAVSIEAVGRRDVAKEAQAVRVESGGQPVLFKAGADQAEVAPGRVGIETTGHDAPGVVIGGEDQCLQLRSGPPLVRRGIVLIEFSDGRALPASARFGARRVLSDEGWIMLLDVIGDSGAGALELEAPFQLLGDEGVVERPGKRQDFFEKGGDTLGP